VAEDLPVFWMAPWSPAHITVGAALYMSSVGAEAELVTGREGDEVEGNLEVDPSARLRRTA